MAKIELFEGYLNNINNSKKQKKMEEVLLWVNNTFKLDEKVAWNQPMFTDHGTFIIGFSVAKHHISVAPESKTIHKFSK